MSRTLKWYEVLIPLAAMCGFFYYKLTDIPGGSLPDDFLPLVEARAANHAQQVQPEKITATDETNVSIVPVGAEQRIIPQKANADRWLSEFQKLRDQTMDALVLSDLKKLNALLPAIDKSIENATALFGEFQDCERAASHLKVVWSSEQSLLLNPTSHPHISLSGAAKAAWEGGQWYGECRNFIDDLK